MKFKYVARNLEINEKLKTITEQKLTKLEKYFGDEVETKVNFKKQGRDCVLEVMLSYAGKLVRAEATGENFYDGLDIVLPKLEGQIRKHRTRFDKHSKNTAFKEDSIFTSGDGGKNLSVVKEKKFKLKPMTLEEAIEDIELTGYSFYVFLDAKTNTVQVLYKRKDGDLGLIEPEI